MFVYKYGTQKKYWCGFYLSAFFQIPDPIPVPRKCAFAWLLQKTALLPVDPRSPATKKKLVSNCSVKGKMSSQKFTGICRPSKLLASASNPSA